uniref:Uncharacterized protein n=1 Tax=Romanomermis culicivorax TaxID=13658 RepID=A0A915HYV1_ROMCU
MAPTTKRGRGGRGDKDKEQRKENKQYCTKASVNGGVVGENRRQIEVVFDNRGDCHYFDGSGRYGSRADYEGHRVHQNEPNGSCGCDRDRCCRGGGMMMYTFAIEAEREDSRPKAAAINDGWSEGKPVGSSGCGGNKFHQAEKSCRR